MTKEAASAYLSAVHQLPFNVEPVPNDPRLEVMFELLDPLPPVRKKRMIIRAVTSYLIDEQEASQLMGVYGLGEY